MNDVQQRLLDLLLEIDAICEEHGLHYYLGGGCLVGAIRQGGFLPWDDDADIHMTRADALKLIELSHEGKLPENRTVVSYHDYEYTPMLHWRYMDTSTTVMQRSTYVTDTPQGQFIDIFVLFPAPDGKQEQDRYIEDFRVYWDLSQQYVFDSRRSADVLKRYSKWRKIANIPLGKKVMDSYFRKRLFERPEEKSNTFAIMSPSAHRLMPSADLFGTPVRVPFEDVELCVPEQAKKLLCKSYGASWYELPRVVERGEHVFILDTNAPYTEYFKDFDAITDRAANFQLDSVWKAAWMHNVAFRNYANPKIHEMRLRTVAMSIDKRWAEQRELMLSAMRNGDYAAVAAFFSDYQKAQFSNAVSYWGLFVPINDEALWACWHCEFMHGHFAQPKKIIERRMAYSNEPLSDKLQKLYETLCDAEEFARLRWTEGDEEGAAKALERLESASESSVFVYRAHLALNAAHENPTEESQGLLAYANQALSLFPHDGEVSFWKAELLRSAGRNAEALPYYQDAQEYAVNGILQTKAKIILKNIYESK